jgi:hypothetical protein
MAYTTRTHGDSQPVFAFDIQNGAQTGTIASAATVQIQGPKLDFFKILVKDVSATAIDLRAQLGTLAAVESIVKATQQLATIMLYQVEGDTSGQVSVAVYPTGAWTTSTLQSALQGLGTVNGADMSGTVVTNGAFKLA